MDSSVAHKFSMLIVYNDGRVKRLLPSNPYVPPSDDPITSVRSKDVIISPEVSARLYLPPIVNPGRKLPVLVYVHGGAFCMESAFSEKYHQYMNLLVAAADVVAVSVEYRLVPENPISACYEDSWTALRWVTEHQSRQGSDPWLNEFADLGHIFLVGESAGANIVHNLAVRTGLNGLGPGSTLAGIVLIHPFFGHNKPDRYWDFLSKEKGRIDDPRFYPAADMELLARVGCQRILVCIAGKDLGRNAGWNYCKALERSEWGGIVDIQEIEGEKHVFHLDKPNCDNSRVLMRQVVSFINQNKILARL